MRHVKCTTKEQDRLPTGKQYLGDNSYRIIIMQFKEWR